MTYEEMRRRIAPAEYILPPEEWPSTERTLEGEFARITAGVELTPRREDSHDQCIAELLVIFDQTSDAMGDLMAGGTQSVKIGSVSMSGPFISTADILTTYNRQAADIIRRHYTLYRGATQKGVQL